MTNFKEFFNFEMDINLIKTYLPNFFLYSIYFFAIFFVILIISKILNKKFEGNSLITPKLIKRTLRPIYLLVGVLYLLNIIQLIAKLYPENVTAITIINNLPKIEHILIAIFLGFVGLIFVKNLQKNYIYKASEGKEKEIDIVKVDMLGKAASISILTIMIGAIMHALGVGFGALATIGGLGGLIIGFSTKDLFSNFFGLFSIYLDRPFTIGERINIPEKNIKGVIEEIGLRITSIRTDNKTLIYLPNSIFNTLIIENNSRFTNKIYEYSFTARHQNNLDLINNVIEKLKVKLSDIANADKKMVPLIEIIDIDSENITLKLKFFLNAITLEDFIISSNLTMRLIYSLFTEAKINIIGKDVNQYYKLN